MSDVKAKSALQKPSWVFVGIWVVLLIIMWILYSVFAPSLMLFIFALIITIGGPALYYGLLWYKTNKK
ncbi:MAG: hypothetical protein KGD58_18985 [Candidatus Lokiarchaeota archaeon]|nr:hypothetical protein [Candidatus Lokiarchaeota archaeon]